MAITISKFEDRLASYGFDVTHSFAISALDFQLSDYLNEAIDKNCSGILIGNSRALWGGFLSWLEKQEKWEEITNPIELYTQQSVESACSEFLPSATIYWMHETNAYVVPGQQLAHSTGLAFLSAGRFNIHPQYGAWFALRALIIVKETFPIDSRLAVNPSTNHIELKAQAIFNKLSAVLAVSEMEHTVKTKWKKWLALRDIYQVGKEYRYSNAQIEYHYTHKKSVLLRELHAIRE